MKTILSPQLVARQKDAMKKLDTVTAMRPYGLNIRSTFPLPIKDGIISEAKCESAYPYKDFFALESTEEALLNAHFSAPFDTSDLPHTWFAEAHVRNGIFVNLNKKDTPAVTITLSSTKPTSIAYVFIVIQANSKGSVIINHALNAPSHTVVNVICLENSELEVVLWEPQTNTPHFSLQHNILYRGAQLKTLQVVEDTDMLQTQIHSKVGANASISQNHIASAHNKQQHDIFSRIVHSAERGVSRMNSRVVLRDQAHTIYRGLVDLEAQSLHTVSTQKEHTLLLSPTAKIDVVPMLEIINDTISCTHSASVSNLDTDQLFYLQSRGFSHAEAEQIMIQGFWEDIWQQFSLPLHTKLAELQ